MLTTFGQGSLLLVVCTVAQQLVYLGLCNPKDSDLAMTDANRLKRSKAARQRFAFLFYPHFLSVII